MRALLCTLALAAFSAPCLAAEEETLSPFHFSGIYTFGWSAVKLGEMDILLDEQPKHFRAETHIRTTGLLNLFAAHASHTTLDSTLNGLIADDARRYECYYTTKKEPRHVRLVYAAGGALKEEVVEPPENRAKRPEVPAAQKKGSLDPLSLLLALRRGLHEGLTHDSKHILLRVFEGRRLMDADFTIAGRMRAVLHGEEVPVIKVIGRRTPLAGYTEKELKGMKEGEPPLVAYFSDDERLVPLRLEVPLPVGMLHADLAQSCDLKAPCALKPQIKVPEGKP